MEWFKELGVHLRTFADVPPLLFLVNLQLEEWAILTTIIYTVSKTVIAIAEFFIKKRIKQPQEQHENHLYNKRTQDN
jgi:hypothetical protein